MIKTFISSLIGLLVSMISLPPQEDLAYRHLIETRIHVLYRKVLIKVQDNENNRQELEKETGQLSYYSRRLYRLRLKP